VPEKNNSQQIERFITEEPQPRLMEAHGLALAGAEIARRSHEYIDQFLETEDLDIYHRAIVRRVIHSTADFSFARSMRLHPHAIERGCMALADDKPVICDVNMVKAGMNSIDNEIICQIKAANVLELARQNNTTRAAAAMELLQDRLEGSLVVVGNAPTALFKLMDMVANGGPRPAVVIGLPVGFVGARESKLALMESGLCYITNTSCKGGSPVAAAAMNALASLVKESR
jgi:precorrin-8X/cobalt-precorrin-8 methylmutase